MSECSWCGKVIIGEPVLTTQNQPWIADRGEVEFELIPAYVTDFCCHGCAWAFYFEIHRLRGMSGKDLRNHLINDHSLQHPPGKPAGGMKHDCIVVSMAQSIASLFDDR